MDNIFNVKLIFNNELINKKDVTTQYQKAINHVIDWLIDGEGEFAFSATSPETSVKVAVLDNNDILLETESSKNFRKIIESIKETITEIKIDTTVMIPKEDLEDDVYVVTGKSEKLEEGGGGI